MEREKLGSRLGFILLSAGCAIGIGNVWKFPYITGQNGGAIFILFYIFFLVILGIPVMTMEFSMGRASQKSPAKMYNVLEPEKSKWHIHSKFILAGTYLLMMLYTVVTAWMLKYFVDMGLGVFEGLSSQGVADVYSGMLSDPGSQIFYMAVVVAAGFTICGIGLQKGLEKVTKVMMLALFVIMLILAVNALLLKGSAKGLAYYLIPDWNRFLEQGPLNVIAAAMNQSFFTLSLGMGAMAIFGSYLEKDRSLLGESVNVAVLDTFVAVTAGLIIIPSCFAYHVKVDAGPSLIFLTLPNIFNSMPGGRIWGSLFFLFLFFAAFSTILAVFEGIIASTMDFFGWSRKKACLYNTLIVFVLSIPCILGFNVLSSLAPLGEGTTIMDLEDFLVSNILLPLGSMLFVVFCTWNFGWGWKNFRKEANAGKGLKVPDWIHPYCKYVLPVIIFVIFIFGLL